MTSVYLVVADEHYQELDIIENKTLRKDLAAGLLRFDGRAMRDVWRPYEVFVTNPLLPRGDVFRFMGGSALAFGKRACGILQPFLDTAGEQLPITLEGDTLAVVNITNVVDCLDQANTERDPDVERYIEKYAFHRDRLPNVLFKFPEGPHIYCSQGIAGDGNDFKSVVERNGVTGLIFVELWSDAKSKPRPKASKKTSPKRSTKKGSK